MSDHSVAVVGAGVAGLAAAAAVDDRADVRIVEKSTVLAGRAATRRRRGCVYDYGANYVKESDPEASAYLDEHLATRRVDTSGAVWTFDEDGAVAEGRDDDEHKWTYRDGISTLGRRLLDQSDATVTFDTRVRSLVREDGGSDRDGASGEHTPRWRIVDTDGRSRGTYDAVVVTPPAPQTAALLDATTWDHPLRDSLVEAARGVPFRTVLSAVLHYPFRVEKPYYALVNTDRAHEVGWVSREECKPGHVPPGESLLVAQMSPDWSAERIDDDPETWVPAAADHVAALFDDERLTDPDWWDHQGWRYALPDAGVDRSVVDEAADHGLVLAGDWVAGEGRVQAALGSGLAAGERVRSLLAENE